MPKKIRTNPKALEARERKDAQKQEKKAKAVKDAEDAYWADDPTAKQKRAAAKEAKAAEQAKKRAEKKALLEADNATVAKAKPEPKPTRVQLLSLAERRAQEAAAAKDEDRKKQERMVDQPELVQNANHVVREQRKADEARYGKDNIIDAQSLDDAVSALKLEDGKDDKHPEKRMRAAFAEYSEKEMPGLKSEHPTLKLSQLKELLWKNWQKSPDNPMNKKQDA